MVREEGYEANVWHMCRYHKADVVFGFSRVGAMDKVQLDDQGKRVWPIADKKVFVVPDDYIDGLRPSQHSFGSMVEMPFTNMEDPFDADLRKRLVSAIEACGCTALDSGLYIYNGGDGFETSAEVRVLDKFTMGEKNRVVGMTVVPEAQLFAQMGVPYAVKCSAVNPAQGKSDIKVTDEQTNKVMAAADKYVIDVATKVIESYDS
jgi:purine nucleoside phosphorylase